MLTASESPWSHAYFPTFALFLLEWSTWWCNHCLEKSVNENIFVTWNFVNLASYQIFRIYFSRISPLFTVVYCEMCCGLCGVLCEMCCGLCDVLCMMSCGLCGVLCMMSLGPMRQVQDKSYFLGVLRFPCTLMLTDFATSGWSPFAHTQGQDAGAKHRGTETDEGVGTVPAGERHILDLWEEVKPCCLL